MKKAFIILLSLVAAMTANLSAMAQENTIINASFLAKESLYQIVTDPETSWIAQVTTDGLKRIVNLGKPYDAYHIGQSILLYYEDDGQDAGIIELGDTLHFHHLRIY